MYIFLLNHTHTYIRGSYICGVKQNRALPPRSSRGSQTTHLGVDRIVVLLGANPPRDQAVPDRVGQRVIIVPGGGHVPVFDQREVQMPVERFLHGHHVLDVRYGLNADLLALLHLGLVVDHHVWAACGLPTTVTRVRPLEAGNQ